VGIGICIRDDQGQFVRAKMVWYSPILDVDIGEALGLLTAMKWMRDLHLNNVVFELDSKRVVDNFKNNRRDESVLGDIIKDCKNVFYSYFTNSHVEFIRRQANEVAHNLAKVAPCLASFHIFTDIPTCIQNLIINEML
jgi:ribonuclease HI